MCIQLYIFFSTTSGPLLGRLLHTRRHRKRLSPFVAIATLLCLSLTKNPSTFTRVVWAEDSKTGLGFEIEPLQQKL